MSGIHSRKLPDWHSLSPLYHPRASTSSGLLQGIPGSFQAMSHWQSSDKSCAPSSIGWCIFWAALGNSVFIATLGEQVVTSPVPPPQWLHVYYGDFCGTLGSLLGLHWQGSSRSCVKLPTGLCLLWPSPGIPASTLARSSWWSSCSPLHTSCWAGGVPGHTGGG